ncbi:unnamed protein product [Effrenium voratum]|uniref:Uncharacterized protein n=1 Tax=Effrenium voratum TaxID=2562239 RepID=A0AA36N3W7_9DINO|nr:unnamed protein product [Effrenium voratum]
MDGTSWREQFAGQAAAQSPASSARLGAAPDEQGIRAQNASTPTSALRAKAGVLSAFRKPLKPSPRTAGNVDGAGDGTASEDKVKKPAQRPSSYGLRTLRKCSWPYLSFCL